MRRTLTRRDGQRGQIVVFVAVSLLALLGIGALSIDAAYMYDKRNKLTDQVADDVRGHFGPVVFDTVIPRNVRVSEAPSHGLPVIIYDHACAGSQAYVSLAAELIRRLRERVG